MGASDIRFEFDALEFFSILHRSRDTFLLNHASDFGRFESQVNSFNECWKEFGRTKDSQGGSHAGLLVLSSIVQRHAVLAFQALSSYQSFLAWMTLRPGLEAFLFIGKWVDDAHTARIWSARATDRKSYRKVFEGEGLKSRSIPECEALRSVLGKVNDSFMHPNPSFAYRDQASGPGYMSIQYLETDPVLHEAHLIAFLNLVDHLYTASCRLREQVLGKTFVPEGMRVGETERKRAQVLADRDLDAKTILEDLGLWRFE